MEAEKLLLVLELRYHVYHFIGLINRPEKHLINLVPESVQEFSRLEVLTQGSLRDFQAFQRNLKVEPFACNPLNFLHPLLLNQVLLQAGLSGCPAVLEAVAISGKLYDFRPIRGSSRGYLATGSTHRIISGVDLALEYETDHVVYLLNGFVDRMLLYVFQGSIFLVINLDSLLCWKGTLWFGQFLVLLLWHLLLLFLELLIWRAISVRAGWLNLRAIRFLS